MKVLQKLLFAALCVCLCFACSDVGDELDNDLKSGKMLGADKTHETVMVTKPFKANFSVWRLHPMGEGEACDGSSNRETMVGSGNITHLGKISTFMTFCVNSTFGYSFTEPGYFMAANGDMLYIDVPDGQIIGPVMDGYQAHFNDTIYFTGGTGRFEGASGKALTNAHVFAGDTDNEFRTDFFSEGTITMMRGK